MIKVTSDRSRLGKGGRVIQYHFDYNGQPQQNIYADSWAEAKDIATDRVRQGEIKSEYSEDYYEGPYLYYKQPYRETSYQGGYYKDRYNGRTDAVSSNKHWHSFGTLRNVWDDGRYLYISATNGRTARMSKFKYPNWMEIRSKANQFRGYPVQAATNKASSNWSDGVWFCDISKRFF